jgi:hypothetical protein
VAVLLVVFLLIPVALIVAGHGAWALILWAILAVLCVGASALEHR